MIAHDADLKGALRHLPAPEPSPELLQRILRSRSTGRRITVPTLEAATSWRWIAAAAAVGVLITGSWVITLSLSKIGESVAAGDRLNELLRETRLWPPDPPQKVHREIPPPAYALIKSDDLDTSRLTPGVWTYRSETTTDDVLTGSSGGSRIRLTRATFAGRPVWMLNTARRFRGNDWTRFEDTTYLDAGSLRPLRATASGNTFRIRFDQTFSGDSVHEAIDMTGPMKKSLRGGVAFPFGSKVLFVSDWSTHRLSVVSPALHLTRGWRGSLYQVASISWDRARSIAPLDLRVVGRERVTVPAGTFDCWRLEVVSHVWGAENRSRMWVSRDKGWVIKEHGRGSDYVINRMLESYEPLE